MGDDAARLQLFENNLKRDELRYGQDYGKLAENDSSQDSVYVLCRQGYEEGQNTSDYPEYSKKAKEWEDLEEVAIIYGGYVLRTVDRKRYELKGHLGNVRVIISDVKDATLGAQGGATAFAAIVEHYSNYYPFGMEKPSMVFDKGAYRYGFNGQEQVNEISGAANHNTALFWEFDMRTARRWNLDPKPDASVSEYAIFGGNPIWFSDVLGDTLRTVNDDDKDHFYTDASKVFGIDAANLFSFDEKNRLSLTKMGERSYFMAKQAKNNDMTTVYEGVIKLIESQEITDIHYVAPNSEIINTVTAQRFGKKGVNINQGGGEITLTLNENKLVNKLPNFDRNMIFLSTDLVQNSYGDKRYNNLFHAMGHVLFQKNNEQEKVIDFDNTARILSGDSQRAVDAKHTNTPNRPDE